MRVRLAKKIARLIDRKVRLRWKRGTKKLALDIYWYRRFKKDKWSERAW